ncbi:hypothetical protein BKA67DRAFT_656701 [Truncatella angustata]|uniref:Uncharacterized protein n=1 Tax=Truncatella angustata TaxID=152316 RepID=A0A9P8UUE5_9PEZI|nr:uncharacterized protein BKA67DRAFT_656701 [Truncatella angustata]KAH6658511.1 hypothetical protein BKA67DRAFT_656701 [Truncatella angustata]
MFRVFREGWRSLSAAKPHFSPTATTRYRISQRLLKQRVQSSFSRQPRGPASQYTVLRSGFYGTIYLSIALLVTDETLDWTTRQNVGIEAVQEITRAETHEEQLKRFWALGPALLKAHTGTDVQHHDPIQPTEDSGLEEDLEVRTMTAPDPESPGTDLLLCQAAFVHEEEPEFYVSTHHNRMADAAHSLSPGFEEFARSQNVKKGALLLIHPDGNWYCLYYDGRRWLNMIFLEWQTAESMGLP